MLCRFRRRKARGDPVSTMLILIRLVRSIDMLAGVTMKKL